MKRRGRRRRPIGKRTNCVLDECRYFEDGMMVYVVDCLNSEHRDVERCPAEHEMFRTPVRTPKV